MKNCVKANVLEAGSLLHGAEVMPVALAKRQDGPPGTKHPFPIVRKGLGGSLSVNHDALALRTLRSAVGSHAQNQRECYCSHPDQSSIHVALLQRSLLPLRSTPHMILCALVPIQRRCLYCTRLRGQTVCCFSTKIRFAACCAWIASFKPWSKLSLTFRLDASCNRFAPRSSCRSTQHFSASCHPCTAR